jgi:hypothetical protein
LRPLPLILALSACLLASSASAEWLREGLILSTDPHVIPAAGMAPDGSGGVLIWWDSWGYGRPTTLRAVRVHPGGDVYNGWDAPGLPSATVVGAPDGSGGFFRAWSGAAFGTQDLNVFAHHVLPEGGLDPAWPQGGVPVAATAAAEIDPAITPDGAGGAFACWVDGNGTRLAAKRLLADGTLAPGWDAGGLTLCDPSGGAIHSSAPAAASDRVGGALVAWQSNTTRVQRVTAGGAVAPGWSAAGLELSNAAAGSPNKFLGIFDSGVDHAIVAWFDNSSGTRGVYLQRFRLDGTLDPSWPAQGLRVAASSVTIGTPVAITDPNGGVAIAWQQAAEVRGTRVRSDGTVDPSWPAFGRNLLDEAAELSDGAIALAPGPDGGLVVCFDDHRRPGVSLVRARWLMADGSNRPDQPDSGRVVSPDTQLSATARAAIADGSGGIYVVWVDFNLAQAANQLKLTWVPFSNATGVERDIGVTALQLSAPWPNPATRSLSVGFALAGDFPARLELLDLAGRRIEGRTFSGAGERSFTFERIDRLPAGIYFIRLTQGSIARSRRVAIVR